MDIVTNSFCAGGNVLGNGTWINIGGNQAIGYGGLNADPLTGPYQDGDGGKATRRLDVCGDDSCDWIDDGSNYMTTRRWYPTLETLEDGTMIVVRPSSSLLPFLPHSCHFTSTDRRMRLGRIRQRRRTEQPDVRVLPEQGRARRSQHPNRNSSGQPLPPHLAPSLRQHLHPG
jgi:hypothetical protein